MSSLYYMYLLVLSLPNTIARNYLSTCVTKAHSAHQSKFKVLTIKLHTCSLRVATLERFCATPQTFEGKKSRSAMCSGILCLEF